MTTKCPACNSEHIVKGRYLDQIGGGLYQVFRPDGLKILTLAGCDVRIPDGDRFTSCTDCGLLWSSVNQRQLLKVIAKHGNKKTKSLVGLK